MAKPYTYATGPIGRVHLVDQAASGPPAQLTLCGQHVEGYTLSTRYPRGRRSLCRNCDRVADADARSRYGSAWGTSGQP
jgi:hypothetical protein